MNIHSIIDKSVVYIGALFGLKFFGEKQESRPVKELIEDVKITLPEFTGKGEYDVSAKTSIGEIKTCFKVTQWKGFNFPTIVFQHGSGDQPYYKRINKILPPGKNPAEANIITINAPFNKTQKSYMKAVKSLEKFAYLFAISTVLFEEIVEYLKEKNASAKVIVSGISLGGWSTNFHHTYFNTANEYRPLLAGAAPDDLFINTVYKKMTDRKAQEKEAKITEVLNFEEDFSKIDHKNVYPLMGKYDEYIVFDRQTRYYINENITVLDKGHVTASTANKDLQDHLIKGLC